MSRTVSGWRKGEGGQPLARYRQLAPSTQTWTGPKRSIFVAAVLGLVVASLISVAVAPLLMPASYSWVEHAVSATAAQGLDHAWLTRLGFLLQALAVLLLVELARERWGVWGRSLHRLYAISVVAAAIFSQSHWEPLPFDILEDFLHSGAAFGVGIGFTLGVLVIRFRRAPHPGWIRLLDLVAVAAALVIPLIMFYVPTVAGAAERLMFIIAYLWYGTEAILSVPTVRSG
jgi:hypothetical protein